MNKKNKSKKLKVKTNCVTEGQERVPKDEEIFECNNIETKTKKRKSKNYESEVNVSIIKDLSKSNNINKKKKKNIEEMDITVPAKKTKSDCDLEKSTSLDSNVSVNKEKCPLNNEQKKVMENDKNRLKYLNAEESQIKDEDIDQYCEDLDEESNSQYEKWIKLIDTKLHSKTTK